MSRSYKKNPVCKIKCKNGKHFANAKVRRCKFLCSKGSMYKKIYPQYDVCDYILYWDWAKAIKDYRNPNSYISEQFSTEKEFSRYWYKCAAMK